MSHKIVRQCATKPIKMKTKSSGVRLDVELLEHLKKKYNIKTCQQAVTFLEGYYKKNWKPEPITEERIKQIREADLELLKANQPAAKIEIQEPISVDLEAQIASIKREQCPAERNTPLGRKIWQKEQNARLWKLQHPKTIY